MRLATVATLNLSALLAACSSGPSENQKSETRDAFVSCMEQENVQGENVNVKLGSLKSMAPTLKDVSIVFGGLNAEKIIKQDKPDFTISAELPSYEQTSKDGGKSIVSKMDVGVTFRSVGGKESVSISGSKFTMDGKVGRNNPLYTEDIDVTSQDFQGINIAGVLQKGRVCAAQAQEKLKLQ